MNLQNRIPWNFRRLIIVSSPFNWTREKVSFFKKTYPKFRCGWQCHFKNQCKCLNCLINYTSVRFSPIVFNLTMWCLICFYFFFSKYTLELVTKRRRFRLKVPLPKIKTLRQWTGLHSCLKSNGWFKTANVNRCYTMPVVWYEKASRT